MCAAKITFKARDPVQRGLLLLIFLLETCFHLPLRSAAVEAAAHANFQIASVFIQKQSVTSSGCFDTTKDVFKLVGIKKKKKLGEICFGFQSGCHLVGRISFTVNRFESNF